MQVVLDKQGRKASVLVPFKQWEKLNADFTKLQNKLNVLIGIQQGLREIKEAKRTGKKMKTLTEALNEI